MGAGLIIMTGAPQHRLDLAKKFGVDEIINIEQVTDYRNRVKQVLEMTNGRGADLVVEAAGSAHAILEGLEMLRRGGVYYELGNTWATGSVELVPSEHLVRKSVRLIVRTGAPQQYDTVIRMMQRHRDDYPFEEIVTHRFSLDETLQSFEVAGNLEALKALVVF
jgi:5-exo-hydroxycamphor dehydrogenase